MSWTHGTYSDSEVLVEQDTLTTVHINELRQAHDAIYSGGIVFDATKYGVVADCQLPSATAAGTSGSRTLTVSAATFSSSDVGKGITIKGAGNGGADRRTTISGYASSTVVTLTDALQTTVTTASFYFGTRINTYLQEAVNEAYAAGGGEVRLPPGALFMNNGHIDLKSNVVIRGAGKYATTLYGGEAGAYMFYRSTTGLTGARIEDLTIDLRALTNASGIQLWYAQGCIVNRVRVKNIPSGGWGIKLGVQNPDTDTELCENNKFIDVDFDTMSGSLEMFLIFNAKNTEIVRPLFTNRSSGPALGLWQKTYGTKIISPTFKDITGNFTPIYYSITCHDTIISDPYFENTPGCIGGSNVSDYGDFGEDQTDGLVISNLIARGGANSVGQIAINLNGVKNVTVSNPQITGHQIGIFIGKCSYTGFGTTNFKITNPVIYNNNQTNDNHTIHPGILFGQIGGDLYGTIALGSFYDDQGTKTQRYPIAFAGSYTWDYINIIGNRLSADVANGGVSVLKTSGAAFGSHMIIRDNQDYSGTNPAEN